MSLNISALDNICTPIDGWFFISEYSSGVSFEGFKSILSGIPILCYDIKKSI